MLSRNLVFRNCDVLVCAVGLVRHPVSCLGVWSSTVNNDAISRLQICSPRCWIYCAEPDILTAHWNWVGNWSANSSSEHIPNWSFKNIWVSRVDTVGLKVANTDWDMYQLHNYRPFCFLLCWQFDDRDNRTQIAGHNHVITSPWKCPQRSFPHWQGAMSSNPVARETPGDAGLQANQTHK